MPSDASRREIVATMSARWRTSRARSPSSERSRVTSRPIATTLATRPSASRTGETTRSMATADPVSGLMATSAPDHVPPSPTIRETSSARTASWSSHPSQVPADELGPWTTDMARSGEVGIHDPAVLVGDHDRLRRLVDGRAQCRRGDGRAWNGGARRVGRAIWMGQFLRTGARTWGQWTPIRRTCLNQLAQSLSPGAPGRHQRSVRSGRRCVRLREQRQELGLG